MRRFERFRMSAQGLMSSKISLSSNILALTIGLVMLGSLLALRQGVGEFLEAYCTRTMALESLLAFAAPGSEHSNGFPKEFRTALETERQAEIRYHDVTFGEIAVSLGREVTVALRSADADDPEIERLETVAGKNIPKDFDPLRPPVVIPLARAHRLSDLDPAELIGTEIAITMGRSLSIDDEDELASVYGEITGIVGESPDESVYVPWQTLAAIAAWQRKTTSPESDVIIDETEPADTEEVFDSAERRFQFATIGDAWQNLAPSVADDSILYPHLRLHLPDVETLESVRDEFRRQGIATTSVLDDVAAVRELRRYALLVGGIVGFITLLAAKCSIFNTLLASVARRMSEFALFRALGGSPSHVLQIVLMESVLIALLGSLCAVGMTILVTDLLNRWFLEHLATLPEFQKLMELEPTLFLFPWWLAAVLVGVGILAAVLAGLIPAIQACRVAPGRVLQQMCLVLAIGLGCSSVSQAQFVSSDEFSRAEQWHVIKNSVRLSMHGSRGTASCTGSVVGHDDSGFIVASSPHCWQGDVSRIVVEAFDEGWPRPSRAYGNVRVLAGDAGSEFGLLYVKGTFPHEGLRICPPETIPRAGARVLSVGCEGGVAPNCEEHTLLGHDSSHWACTQIGKKGRSGGPLIWKSPDGQLKILGCCCCGSGSTTLYSYLDPMYRLMDRSGLAGLYRDRTTAGRRTRPGKETPLKPIPDCPKCRPGETSPTPKFPIARIPITPPVTRRTPTPRPAYPSTATRTIRTGSRIEVQGRRMRVGNIRIDGNRIQVGNGILIDGNSIRVGNMVVPRR